MEITNPVIREYLSSVMPERESTLQDLYRYATENSVPIIKHEMEQFLTFIVTLHQPLKILEIGTAVGYSAIILAKAAPKADIVTLELSERMILQAKKNFVDFGITDRVELIQGDAVETIKCLDGPYDLIFLDAAKGQYMNFYEASLRVLKPGGLLIADNVLQDGLIAKSRFAIPRRQRTIHSRMRTFIKALMAHPALTTVVLPIADGATISIMKR